MVALHVNHKLRGAESDDDEQFVRALGVPVLVEVAPPMPGNIEQETREARYSWFRKLIQQGIVDKVALGHTRSDKRNGTFSLFARRGNGRFGGNPAGNSRRFSETTSASHP